MYSKKDAVALLITVVFVMLFSIALGIGIKNLNEAKNLYKQEKLFFQSEFLVNDILTYLKNSSDLNNLAKSKDPASLYLFISSMKMFPLKISGYTVLINIKSARDKVNINCLKTKNQEYKEKRIEVFRRYFLQKRLDENLLYMIMDCMQGYKKDSSYFTDIFDKEKELFRDYIASNRHLEKILISYEKKYHDNVFAKLKYKKIFNYDPDESTKIDLNYLTPQGWQFISGCSKEQAVSLHKKGGLYKTIADIALPSAMLEQLKVFNISFFEPYIQVEILVSNERTHGTISFEYNIVTKKASRFVYKI